MAFLVEGGSQQPLLQLLLLVQAREKDITKEETKPIQKKLERKCIMGVQVRNTKRPSTGRHTK